MPAVTGTGTAPRLTLASMTSFGKTSVAPKSIDPAMKRSTPAPLPTTS